MQDVPQVEVSQEVPLIGCVMTNQMRKDWGVAALTCAQLAETLKGKVRFWWHCDVSVRHWNLYALIEDYQLGEYVDLTFPPADDKWMAEMYCKCSCTFLPSSEGFGFPLFESLACGTPVVHTTYGGGGSVMGSCGLHDLLVDPVAIRMEGQQNVVRPVFYPEAFHDRICEVLHPFHVLHNAHEVASRVEHLMWKKLAPRWKKWLRDGL